MRLFVAVELSDDQQDQLAALKTNIPGANWVQRPALHLTLRFLGDRIEPIRLTPICTALESVRVEPFPLTVRGVGRFPERRRPARVLWAGIDAPPALARLHDSVERALGEVGFEPDERAFSPHVTLARLKLDGASPELDQFLARQRDFQTEPHTVTSFTLFSSLLTPQGAKYTAEQVFALAPA